MLNTLLLLVHVFVALVLILVVLLQSGKGAGLGGAFGGGTSQSVFGARGPQSFLGKFTTGAAIVFMLTSLTLSVIGAGAGHSTVVDQMPAAPAAPQAAEEAAPAAPAPAATGDIDPFKAVQDAQSKQAPATGEQKAK